MTNQQTQVEEKEYYTLNSVKLLTLTQVEQAMQIVIDKVNGGKVSYSKKDVILIIKTIYNALMKTATDNAKDGFRLPPYKEEENVVI